jgi:ADP-ribose pyrophosphatase
VVPIEDENIVLVRQYRPALEKEMLEIPAGKLDIEGEEPEKAARRELIEETGLDASNLQELCSFYNSAGFSDEKTVIYLATEMTQVEKMAASVEEQYMTTEKVPLEDVHELIDSGYITDAKTIIGIYSALRSIGK